MGWGLLNPEGNLKTGAVAAVGMGTGAVSKIVSLRRAQECLPQEEGGRSHDKDTLFSPNCSFIKNFSLLNKGI